MTAFSKAAGSALLLLGAAACTSFYEVPIETPLQPKLDVGRFQRILVAGFLAGGSEEVDTNLETARLLRSQLRAESRLEVIDADVLDLLSIADSYSDEPGANGDNGDGGGANGDGAAEALGDEARADLTEEELETYEHIFANVSYWRQLGEEHQNPLIVTGSVYFTPHQRSGMVHAGTGALRRVRSAARRAGAQVQRPQRLHSEPEVHLHRRPERRHPLHRTTP